MPSMIEGLENRQLLAAATLLRVSSVTADNRGEVVIQLSERATGVKGAAVQLYTAGADGKLFTSDDVKQSVRFTYSTNKKQIKLTGHLPKDTPYRVKLDGKTRVKSAATGALLDGDFKGGTTASGDGKAGGNYEFQANRDASSTPLVKMRTGTGDVIIRIRGDAAPVSANAFLALANSGKYDNLFVARSVPGFVIQTGAVQVTGTGTTASDLTENTASSFPEELPRQLSNLRGTLSFARGGSGKLASNQFFFNIADNDGSNGNNLDDASGTGVVFTPFAEVTSAAGLATLDAMAAKPRINFSSGGLDIQNYGGATPIDNVPVNDVTTVQNSGVNPSRDFIIIYRTGVLMNVSAKG